MFLCLCEGPVLYIVILVLGILAKGPLKIIGSDYAKSFK
jgi:hypothetical protein